MEEYKTALLKLRDDTDGNKTLFDDHKSLGCLCPACKSVANIDRELLEVNKVVRSAERRGKSLNLTKKNVNDLLDDSYSVYIKLSGSIKAIYSHYNKKGRNKNEFAFR